MCGVVSSPDTVFFMRVQRIAIGAGKGKAECPHFLAPDCVLTTGNRSRDLSHREARAYADHPIISQRGNAMEIRTVRRPGEKGTQGLLKKYGERLVCISYRIRNIFMYLLQLTSQLTRTLAGENGYQQYT